jgi:phosphoenolpyruvate---glycerone phosphotransferase subunit DhaL
MANVTGALIAKSLVLVAKKVEQNKDYLCELDGEVGDGDHGVSMTIGMRAVSRAAKAFTIHIAHQVKLSNQQQMLMQMK